MVPLRIFNVPALGTYNFSLVDSTWDFLIAQGTHPIVELSFMPAFLANCTWHGHCKQDRIGCEGYWCTQCSGHGVGPVVNAEAPEQCHALEFWYQGIKQVPYQKDYTPWFALVKTTAQHAVDRYGLAEVQQWSFEVWNELWGLSFPEDYVWPARLDLDGYRPIPAARPAFCHLAVALPPGAAYDTSLLSLCGLPCLPGSGGAVAGCAHANADH